MATKGSVSTSSWISKYGYSRYMTFTWERTSFNVEAQTSTISWKLTGGGSFTGQVKSGPFYVNLDGEQLYYSDSRISFYADTVIATGTKTIKHNSDGTKTFSISLGAAIYSSAINKTGSANFTLDIVGKATLTSAPNFSDEGNPTITYSNPVGNAASSVSACISFTGEQADVAYRDIPINGTSYTFNLTEEERDVLRAGTTTANNRIVRFYVRSIIDGIYYFSWKEVYLTIINAHPDLSCSVKDVNTTTVALTGDNKKLIKHHSTAEAAIVASAYKKATISKTSITNGDITSAAASYQFKNITSNDFEFSATDSRGNSVYEALKPTMVEYLKPTANITPNGQMNTQGEYTLKASGNYFNGSFGATANTLTFQYRYKLKDADFADSDWKTATPTIKDNTYSIDIDITGLNYREIYKFQIRITDKLNDVLSKEELVSSLPVFHWGANDFVFEVPVRFNAGFEGEGSSSDSGTIDGNADINGDLDVSGTVRLSGTTPNNIYFGNDSNTLIGETATDTLSITATTINLTGNVSINGKPIVVNSTTEGYSGVWVPALGIASAVSSYTIQQGWFSWVGDVINIGWNIKATIKSGYDTQPIAITGCPFYPLYSAFGGGIAHNIQFAAGYNFEGWCLEESDGFIRPRGQPCNNTSKTPLQITSTAYYPSTNGTVVSLAGSICLTASGAG